MGINSNITGPPLIPIDPVQFPNMGSRNYMMGAMELPDLSRSLRATSSTGAPIPIGSHLNYAIGGSGGCFTMSGLNLNLGGGGVGTSLAPQQPIFRAPQQDMNAEMMAASTLGMENGYGVVDVNVTNAVGNRFATNLENCMDFDGYWPNYN